jgi:hypothetical protein
MAGNLVQKVLNELKASCKERIKAASKFEEERIKTASEFKRLEEERIKAASKFEEERIKTAGELE